MSAKPVAWMLQAEFGNDRSPWPVAVDSLAYQQAIKRHRDYTVSPLYDQAAIDAAVAAERERCAVLEAALESLVNRCNADFGIAADDAVIAAEAALERLYRSRTKGDAA